jgi:hypothetical protein
MDDSERPRGSGRDEESQGGEANSTPEEEVKTRDEGDGRRNESATRPGLNRPRQLSRFLDSSKIWVRKATGQTKDITEKAVATTRDAVAKAKREGGRRLQESSDDVTTYVDGDRISQIRESNNPLLRLEEQKVPQNFVASFVYAAAAAGVVQNAEEVTRFTRGLMDHDSAAVQELLRRVFNPEQAKEISAWMDRVPGTEFSGGYAHRLFHGHDLNAMYQLMQDHGALGAAEWANHVWLRDFWTPHGVPYLPTGSGTVYSWLRDMGVAPATAMSLLTVNSAEAASGILAFFSVRRAVRGAKVFVGVRRYRQAVDEVEKLAQRGMEADAVYKVADIETFLDSRSAPHLRLDLALFCLEQSYKPQANHAVSWGTHAFEIASSLCRPIEGLPKVTPYHGETKVSFHGIAAYVTASAYASLVQRRDSDWTSIAPRLEFGIDQFLTVSDQQAKKRSIPGLDKPAPGYRPYSALTNQLLALELVTAFGPLFGTTSDPIAIRRQMEKSLRTLAQDHGPSGELATRISRALGRVYPWGAATSEVAA